MKTITLSAFRKEPGEYLRSVSREGQSFLLTKAGKPVARLVPVDDTIVIARDGSVYGEKPLTFRMRL